MSKNSKKFLWVLIITLTIVGLYLNRSYAYFFDYLKGHQIMPDQSISEYAVISDMGSKRQRLYYVFLGDSLTLGVGVEDKNLSYPYWLFLNAAKKNDIYVYNLAVPGARVDDLIRDQLIQLEGGNYNHVPIGALPDVVFLEIGMNDVITAHSETAFKTSYQVILTRLAKHHQYKDFNLVVLNIPPLSSSKILLPPYNYLMDLRTRQFNSIIESLTQQNRSLFKKVVYVDLYNQTKKQFQSDPTNFSVDKFHPSAKGYKLWSEIINANLNN